MAEPSKTRPGDQQLPAGGRECVQDALIAFIQERKELGIERYGSPLMTHNGRDGVRDALEEAVDLAVYLMQVTMEMRDLRAELEAAREERDAARLVSKGRTMEEHHQAEELTRLRTALLERTAELAELRDLQIGLKSLTTDEGGIDMSLHMAHDMMRAVVAGFVKILNEEPAPNYVEMRFSLRDDPDVYTVTIQRPGGKTPGEVADEWKARALQVEAASTGTEARP